MNYSVLIPGRLYAGTKIDRDDWQTLLNLNVNAIVNVSDTPDRSPPNIPSFPHLYFKLGNRSKPSLERLQNAVEQAIVWLQEGRVLYVHDIGGRNRLGFFLTALYMRLYGLPYEQALRVVKQKRHQLAPRYQFVELLKEYEKCLGLYL